jgi:ribosomal protein S5
LVKATFEALHLMRDAHQVAKTRGIALNKVFNG